MSSSSQATRKAASDFLGELRAGGAAYGATVIGLVGDLGAGKTTFVKGLFEGFGLSPQKATSPTFILMRRTRVRRRGFGDIYHIDAYRLDDKDSVGHLGLESLFLDPKNLIVVEWADRIKRFLPKRTKWLRFKIGKKEDERKIVFPVGKR